MCQAIVKEAGVRIFRKTLARAWEENPDSGGFSWLDTDGVVRFKKGYRDFATFWRDYREHEGKAVLIHFRLATHGSKCIENCQPFIVADNVMMAHNGILHEFTNDTKDRSDSRVFAEDIMRPLITKYGMELINNPLVKDTVERLIGWNKLVFLSPAGFTIFGEEMGEWDDEGVEGGRVWWSSGYPTKRKIFSGAFRGAFGEMWQYGTQGEDGWEEMPGGWINRQYSESTKSWEEHLKAKYGAGSIVHVPQLTVFDQKTGAPIKPSAYLRDDHGEPIEIEGEDEGEGLDMATTIQMIRDLDAVDLDEPRMLTTDQFIDAYIKNKERR